MKSYTLYKCIKPECGEIFKLHEIRYDGDYNDSGWLIIKCKKCGSEMKLRVKNPDEYRSWTFPNAEIIRAFDDERIEFGDTFYKKLENYKEPETCLVNDDNKEVEWTPLRTNGFWKTEMFDEIECQYYYTLSEKRISKAIACFKNYYLAGQYRKDLPTKIVVLQKYANHQLVWAKELNKEKDLTEKNLYLVNYNRQKEWPDGVYERRVLLAYLERCLMRWNIFANQVIVVTPFIGFQYKGKKNQETVLGLWDFLDGRLNMDKTFFITRTETKNLLKKTQDAIDVPMDVLEKWQLMDRLQEIVEKQKLKLIDPRFHAKFYAGVFDNHVEVLAGSYNIHTGKGREQVVMSKYARDKFKTNYMDQLVKDFSYKPFIDEDVLFIEVNSKSYKNVCVKSMSEVKQIIGIDNRL